MYACVEHVFDRQKGPTGFSIRIVGLTGTEGRVATDNICYNMHRLIFLERQMAAG